MSIVRSVEAADVPAVIALVSEVLAEFGLSFGVGSATDDALRHLPESYVDAGGAFWVAFDDVEGRSTLIGTCGVFPVEAATFELRKMYLSPFARGRGVGKRLLDDAVEWVRAHGGKKLVLDTVHEMQSAIAFYEKHQFVRDDTQIRGSRCTRGYARLL